MPRTTACLGFLSALALCLQPFAPRAHANWLPYGNAATTATGVQDQVGVTIDGSGGTIVVWRDQRFDGGDIFAQRLSADGSALWTSGGVVICAAANVQQFPQVVSDGRGGAIVAWQDDRVDPSGDMYAQRVDRDGLVKWTAGGVALVTGASSNEQNDASFRMIEDGQGGAFLVFSDNRDPLGVIDPSFGKLWAQHVDRDGTAKWGNGTTVSQGAFAHGNPGFVPDGRGGIIVAWQDGAIFGDWNITAQRLDASGSPQWGTGLTVCNNPSQQLFPDVASDGAGGAVIAWEDTRADANGDIYAQRVDATGSAVWAPNGVALVTGPSSNNSGDWIIRMVSDGAGGAILAFADNRNASGTIDPSFSKVWAQRVDDAGIALWGNGVPVGAAAFAHGNHRIVSDAEGGAIVVWQDGTVFGDWNISASRLDATGALVWSTTGATVTNKHQGQQTWPAAVADGLGGVLAAWTDTRDDGGDAYVNVLNTLGVAGSSTRWECSAWEPNGKQVSGAANDQTEVSSAPDGVGGMLVVWTDAQSDAGDIYVQRMAADGTPRWAAGGVAVSTATGMQHWPKVVSDGRGGAIVAWQDDRTDPNGDMYAQRIDKNGVAKWAVNGVAIVSGPSSDIQNDVSMRLLQDGQGGAILVFSDNRTPTGSIDPSFAKVWAQRVDRDGTAKWGNGAPVSQGAFAHGNPSAIPDGAGGVIVAWQDGAIFGDWNISAQRLDTDGSALWGSGLSLCNNGAPQYLPDAAPDGAGGAIVAWQDDRLDANGDIFAQRVDPTGGTLWLGNGTPLVTGSSSNNSGDYIIRIVSDASGGAIFAFADNRDMGGTIDPSFSKVWAQRVNDLGAPAWGVSGVPVGAGLFAHGNHGIAYDGEGGAVVVWQDGSIFGDWNISAQRLKPNGTFYWQNAGVFVSAAAGQQTLPAIASDGRGGAMAAWPDDRNGTSDIYAEHVCVPNARIVGIEGNPVIGARALLGAPAPNPSGGSVSCAVTLRTSERVLAFVTDVQGRLVETLTDRTMSAGTHSVEWIPGRAGVRRAAGVYFIRVEAGAARASKKVVVLR